MKLPRAKLLLATVVFGALVSTPAIAGGRHHHHGHHHHHGARIGLFIGAPVVWGHWYYPPPYYYPRYYYPPTVAYPPTYIEKDDEESAPPQRSSWWYYCADAKAYYPYVKDCPGGWQRVRPEPPPSR